MIIGEKNQRKLPRHPNALPFFQRISRSNTLTTDMPETKLLNTDRLIDTGGDLAPTWVEVTSNGKVNMVGPTSKKRQATNTLRCSITAIAYTNLWATNLPAIVKGCKLLLKPLSDTSGLPQPHQSRLLCEGHGCPDLAENWRK